MALGFVLAAQILLEIFKLERKILLLTTSVLEVGVGWRKCSSHGCSVLPMGADQDRALQMTALPERGIAIINSPPYFPFWAPDTAQNNPAPVRI